MTSHGSWELTAGGLAFGGRAGTSPERRRRRHSSARSHAWIVWTSLALLTQLPRVYLFMPRGAAKTWRQG
ncbi:MAG: hypothetical protein MZU95_16675 [Desulfomicrobium escambiense]|nr:hypothetical protein [Desulfomicrobium escambiense]